MKHILFLSFYLLSISHSYSQAYSFSQSKELYTFLEDATSINAGNVWSGFQAFEIPIGFPFTFMDSTFTSVSIEATGRLIFDENHYYYADMFVVAGMQDKGLENTLSPLSYQLFGSIGNQILKIEIKNATYKKDLASTINYQIWLHESNGTIELHMGPSTIANSENAFSLGPFSGVFKVTSFSPTTFGYGYAILGSSMSPADTTFVGTGINDFGFRLDNVPLETTVYKFLTEMPPLREVGQ